MVTDIHTRHCCPTHGCKYADHECSVLTGAGEAESACADCAEDAKRRPIEVGTRVPYALTPNKALVREVDGPTPGVFLFRDGDAGVAIAFPRGMNGATGLYDPAQAHLPPHWGAVCTWQWDEAIRHARTVEVLMVDLPFSLPSTSKGTVQSYAGALRKLTDGVKALWEASKSV